MGLIYATLGEHEAAVRMTISALNSIPQHHCFLSYHSLYTRTCQCTCGAALIRAIQVEQFIAATQLDQYLAVAYVVPIVPLSPPFASFTAGIKGDLVVRVLYLAANQMAV